MFRYTLILLTLLVSLLPLSAHAQDDIIAYLDEEYLARVSLDGQTYEFLGPPWADDPEWSRDGRYLAWVASDDCAGLLLYDSVTNTETSLWEHDRSVTRWSPTWSPNGTRIAFAERDCEGVEDPSVIRIIDRRFNYLATITSFGGRINLLRWSPDGQTFLIHGRRSSDTSGKLYLMPATGGPPQALPTPSGINHIRWSPDGTRIAYTATGNGGLLDVFVMNADGSNQVNLTNSPGREAAFDWSPDGTRIVFDRSYTLWTMHSNGSNAVMFYDPRWPSCCPAWQGSPNVIFNPAFEYGTQYWNFKTNGQGNFTITSPGNKGVGAARVQVIKPHKTTHLALSRFRLEPNTRYRLSFAAYSNTARDLSVYINNSTTPSANYGLNNYRANLTKAWKTFNVEFTTKGFTGLTTATQLRFSFGAFAKAGDLYFLDSVILKKVEPGVAAAAVGGVSGMVQTVTSSPLPATVTLVDVESGGVALQAVVQTDTAGGYRFDALPAGLYEVRVQPLDGQPAPEPVQVYVGEESVEELLIDVGEPAEGESAINTLYLPLISQ